MMNRSRMTYGAASLLVALLAVTGCSAGSADPQPDPTTTAIATPEAEEPAATTSPNEPVARASFSFATYAIYEVERYETKQNCGCALEDGGPEMFPAGTQAILYRVVITGKSMGLQEGNTWTVPDLNVTADLLGYEGLAVVEEHEGPERARSAGLAWLPEGLFPDGPGTIVNDSPVSFTVAYYVPETVQTLRMTLTGVYDAAEVDWPADPLDFDIPVM
ncbi:hypothetical protein [Microbacterium amylolyticum]|uniref:Uncharacterized protein n=1 Tax=Microbacterium amylolyticum TaxID=936337 RepID=A0ABS4ZKS4_9MICO|nr:hypothetical protein [Microbacterium amylolyticum]MBP2437900.1 hypothetical protein [Microbacterium amylolyticum]